MNLLPPLFAVAGFILRGRHPHRPERNPAQPRILVIRRNRLGDMICTLPLLHALRSHYPQAHLTVACDALGAPIARASTVVDEVIVLEPGRNRWLAVFTQAARLQGFDWVIAAKGGFDHRLGVLTRLAGGAVRIGFEQRTPGPSNYYTHRLPLPTDWKEHQVETLLRLAEPLGVTAPSGVALTLDLSPEAEKFAATVLAQPPFSTARQFMLINISSTVRLRFRPEDFTVLVLRLLMVTDLAVAFVAAPANQALARELAAAAKSDRVTALPTPGPLELAAVMKRAALLLTPEGGAAHLAAGVGTPALVLWSEGPFDKWRSRADNHAFVRPEPNEATIPQQRVWQALEPLLAVRVEKEPLRKS
jgi:ADP-heptose:LPS heptosyltransferase